MAKRRKIIASARFPRFPLEQRYHAALLKLFKRSTHELIETLADNGKLQQFADYVAEQHPRKVEMNELASKIAEAAERRTLSNIIAADKKRFEGELLPALTSIVEQQTGQQFTAASNFAFSKLGCDFSWSLESAEYERLVGERVNLCKGVPDQIFDLVKQSIHRTVYERAGNPVDRNLTLSIMSLCDKKNDWEAHRIARTESLAVCEAAQYTTLANNGVRENVWVWSRSGYDRHEQLDGEKRKIDQPFSNGLLYPGAPGPPEQVINCMCSIAPDIDDELLKELEAEGVNIGLDKPVDIVTGKPKVRTPRSSRAPKQPAAQAFPVEEQRIEYTALGIAADDNAPTQQELEAAYAQHHREIYAASTKLSKTYKQGGKLKPKDAFEIMNKAYTRAGARDGFTAKQFEQALRTMRNEADERKLADQYAELLRGLRRHRMTPTQVASARKAVIDHAVDNGMFGVIGRSDYRKAADIALRAALRDYPLVDMARVMLSPMRFRLWLQKMAAQGGTTNDGTKVVINPSHLSKPYVYRHEFSHAADAYYNAQVNADRTPTTADKMRQRKVHPFLSELRDDSDVMLMLQQVNSSAKLYQEYGQLLDQLGGPMTSYALRKYTESEGTGTELVSTIAHYVDDTDKKFAPKLYKAYGAEGEPGDSETQRLAQAYINAHCRASLYTLTEYGDD